MTNQVTRSLERHIEHVVSRLVGDAEQRDPLSDDLVAKVERRDLYLGPFA